MSETEHVYLRLNKFHELEVCYGSIEGAELYYHSADYEKQKKRIEFLEHEVKHLKDALRAYGDEDIDDERY